MRTFKYNAWQIEESPHGGFYVYRKGDDARLLWVRRDDGRIIRFDTRKDAEEAVLKLDKELTP